MNMFFFDIFAIDSNVHPLDVGFIVKRKLEIYLLVCYSE